MEWIITAVMVGVFWVLIKSWAWSGRRKVLEETFASLDDFDATDKLVSVDGLAAIAYDSHRLAICLLTGDETSSVVKQRILGYQDILRVEIVEDGEAVTRTNRASQAGGALIGGLALGGVGMIIGGLSGTTSTATKLKSVALRVLVHDKANPNFELFIFREDSAQKRDGILLQEPLANARRWHGILEILIKEADGHDSKEGAALSAPSQSGSIGLPAGERDIVGELQRLATMHQAGQLTDDEFASMKQKLIT